MFSWLNIWRLGIKSLALHPLRSLLTVLGIFIGTASVIWLLAIGEGISSKAQEQIAKLGADNIIIRSIKPPVNYSSQASTSRKTVPRYGITRKEYERFSNNFADVLKKVVPICEVPNSTFIYPGSGINTRTGRLVASTSDYQSLVRLEMMQGRFISSLDNEEKRKFCVISAGIAEKLFPLEEPLDKTIILRDVAFTVIGVTERHNPTAGIGGSLAAQEFERDVYIPIETYWSVFGTTIVNVASGSFQIENVELNQLTLQVKDTKLVLPTADAVRSILKKHPEEDWGVTVPLELLERAKTVRMMFIIFMAIIAAISLVVGGIGIMNIMLATVTERTREIGIRRALGAKRSDITKQFLVETTLLSIVGGVAGVLGGFLSRPATRLMRKLVTEYFPEAMQSLPPGINEIEPIIVPWSVPLAFGISVLIGVMFGLYPARRAAMMDPIEALRHE